MNIKKSQIILFIAVCVITGLVFFNTTAFAKTRLNVVATTPTIGSIASEIGGDQIQVNVISSPFQDPHFVEAKPSYMMSAKKADLWIRVGMELEIGYEELIIDGPRKPKIRPGQSGHLDVSEGIIRVDVPT